jgi:hypothetical protein
VEKPRTAEAWGRHPEVKENRRRVVDRDAATLTEALKRLDERRRSGRAWYVLEAPTQPDVYLDTEEAVIVIEGKRSEPGPTTSTAWMPVRHQMLRQLDAAWEVRQGRRIYGMFIVEAEEASRSVTPSVWREVADMTISEEVLRGSLPHRTPEERSEIAAALLGVTTWQAVCDEFQIPSEVLIPEVFDDRPEPRAGRRQSGSVEQVSSSTPELEAAGSSQTAGE